jgi:cbb3-type cytochrome oxidase subunit 1
MSKTGKLIFVFAIVGALAFYTFWIRDWPIITLILVSIIYAFVPRIFGRKPPRIPMIIQWILWISFSGWILYRDVDSNGLPASGFLIDGMIVLSSNPIALKRNKEPLTPEEAAEWH